MRPVDTPADQPIGKTPEQGDLELYCPECEYNLTGAPGDRCPWCGWRINVASLLEQTRPSGTRRRIAFCGIVLSFLGVGLVVLLLMRSQLSFRGLDGFIVLAVLAAAAGHLALSWLALRPRRFWPMRSGAASGMFLTTAVGSVVCGLIGATSLCSAVPTQLVVRGVRVNGPFEFVLAAILFTLPGWTLLLMRSMSFRQTAARRADDGRTPEETVTGFAPFLVEVSDRFGPDRVHHVWRAAAAPRHPAVDAAIAQTWEAESAVARQEGRKLYNGRLARLLSMELTADGMQLELGPTCYRDFLGTNVLHMRSVIQAGARYLANPLGVSAVLVTTDGFLVFGRRSSSVAINAGALHCIGGMMELAEDASGPPGSFEAIAGEICEELPVKAGELSGLVLIGIARDRAMMQPELIFDAQLAVSRAELTARFARDAGDGEHDRLEMVPEEPDAMVAFMVSKAPISAIAEAAIVLHGRHLWGMTWYERTCLKLYGEIPRARVGW